MKLLFERDVYTRMQKHAEEEYPYECCGFFFGTEKDDVRTATEVWQTANFSEENRRRRFQIDPDDYRKAERHAVERDLELLGVYHSHPDHPAEPSEHDRKVAMPWFSYIIVSVQSGAADQTRSWRLNDDRQFEEETVEFF